VRAEHEREFREFVAARSTALLHTAYLLTGDPHRAQDLLQTTLLAVARRWHAIDNAGGVPEAYARRALYRNQVDWWRARARRPETVTATPPERAGGRDHAADTVTRYRLMQALRSLPERQRAVVVLRYYEDRPVAEVAAVLDLPPATVRSLAARALARLRAWYPDLDDAHEPAEVLR
jgi:RNA polymerase sigma-70 factor (sigma-E family)